MTREACGIIKKRDQENGVKENQKVTIRKCFSHSSFSSLKIIICLDFYLPGLFLLIFQVV